MTAGADPTGECGTALRAVEPAAFKARWVFDGAGPPLENATLELAGGVVADVHTRHNPRAVDLGNAAIIPALVNAHTHLEFSSLAAPLAPAQPFADWIRSVVAHRRAQRSPVEAIPHGAWESARAGTGLLADIVTDDAVPSAYPADGPGVIAFRELIGLLPEQADERLETARRFLEASEASAAVVARGISPHAPYSVGPDLYERLIELARERGVPVAVHLAETAAERELLRHGTGELVDLLAGFGVWSDSVIPRGRRPMDYLRPLAGLERALVVHGNYLEADELAFCAEHSEITVVYCPRTHANFGHGRHPWRELLVRGGRVALGTDSRASNPDLSLFDELRFLYERFPDVEPRALLHLGTIAGAQALGLPHRGQLAAGVSTELAVVRLPEAGLGGPFDLLFAPQSRVSATMRAGGV